MESLGPLKRESEEQLIQPKAKERRKGSTRRKSSELSEDLISAMMGVE